MKCEKCGKELVLGLNYYYLEKKKNEDDYYAADIVINWEFILDAETTCCPNAKLEVRNLNNKEL